MQKRNNEPEIILCLRPAEYCFEITLTMTHHVDEALNTNATREYRESPYNMEDETAITLQFKKP